MIQLIPVGFIALILILLGPSGCNDSIHHGRNLSSTANDTEQNMATDVRSSQPIGLDLSSSSPDQDHNPLSPNPEPTPMPKPDPENHQVPGPLGIAGVAMSWKFSRDLRSRIKKAS